MSSASTTKEYDVFVCGVISPQTNMSGWGLLLSRGGAELSKYVGGEHGSDQDRIDYVALLNGLDLCKSHPEKKFTIYTSSQQKALDYNIYLNSWVEQREIYDKKNSDILLKIFEIKQSANNIEVKWWRDSGNTGLQKETEKISGYGHKLLQKKVIPIFGTRLKIKTGDFPHLGR